MKRPVIIDCDPGADDFLAILLALASPELNVLGITTVFGNASAEQTAWNATRACLAAGKTGVFVYAGAAAPLMSKIRPDFSYCGEDGLCDSTLSGDRALISSRYANEFLVETLEKSQEPVTIISTAAMTNLAVLLRQQPNLAYQIKEIITISGYYGQNPAAARAEWNVLLDPEAAKIVFSAPVSIRAVGLDVTADLRDSYVEQLLSAASGKIAAFMQHTTDFNVRQGLYPRSILVDGMAVAAALRSESAHYQTGCAWVYPERTDCGLMKFDSKRSDRATVYAADHFDFETYIQLLKERVIAK